MSIVFEDIRSLVFPLLIGKLSDDPTVGLSLDDTEFLGTAFFVTCNGIALTAGHLVPTPNELGSDHLLSVIWDGNEAKCHRITASLVAPDSDLAILKVPGVETEHLETDFRRVHMGEDVVAIGIPNDSSWNEDRDFRLFKGHVTRVKNFLELSFPALRGLSGGPALRDGKVVGVISGNHRSEALEDQVSEVEETVSGQTKILRVETKAVVNYGLVEPLFRHAEFRHEMFEDLALPKFLELMNQPNDR